MDQIYIKAIFGCWKQVTKEEAKKFCDNLMKMMPRSREEQIQIINNKHLKGIKYEDL